MVDTEQVHSIEEPVRPAFPQASVPAVPVFAGARLDLVALIVGVVALVASPVPVVNYGACVAALVGLILGVVAYLRRNGRRGIAAAAAAVSVAAVLASVVLAILYSPVLRAVGEAAPAGTSPQASTGPAAERDAATNELGTRGNPASLGTTVKVPSSAGTVDWEVTLGPAMLDADDVVAAADRTTEPAQEGFQYAMVPVTVVYGGTGSGTPWAEFAVDFVSVSGTTHTSSDTFAVAPTPLTDVKELPPGAAGTGNVVVAVPKKDVTEGAWVVTSRAGDQYFFTAR